MTMPADQRLLILGLAERPWGSGRMYQRFLGRYELDENSGLYFDERVSDEHKARIGRAFLALPRQLRQPAYDHKLTVSTTPYAQTAAGNSSTFYGDFRPGAKVSPHVEFSSSSLDDLLEPHLTHELAHLFWGLLPLKVREAYERFLIQSCGKAAVEVTEYVDDRFREWLRSLDIPDTESYAENHRACYLNTWVIESFCDSVAVFLCDGYSWQKCNVDLSSRLGAIESLTGLKLTKPCRAGRRATSKIAASGRTPTTKSRRAASRTPCGK